ncbi:MAG TPA: response regulator transcription factor [Blastocatellia bacterium]|nr:response regulator transcription factor [Blastocatellia bacterium]
MADEIQILIADDHPIWRQGLRQVIESDVTLKVVAEAGDGRQALEQIQQLTPRIVLLDIDMPGLDGLKVALAIRERKLPVDVIFLTVHREESFMNKALDAGARGYILKDSAITDVVAGIKTVISGEHYTSPAMTSYLINRLNRRGRANGQKQGLECLTPTERSILKMIAEYKTTNDIAAALFISPRTVETHRANICQKLSLHGSHSLMKYALSHSAELGL